MLKVALSPDHNERLRAEADVLRRLGHQYIVALHDELPFHAGAGRERVGLLMARAGDRTLADRLRDEGRLHLELLERFGEDLLATIDWLEQKGIPHRDIKPDNLGTAKIGNQLHLVLFDFSLARTPAENVLAGTRHYVDPFLQWRPDTADGQGAYCLEFRSFVTPGSATSYARGSHGTARVAETGPGEWGDTDAFDERLQRALKNRAFLALTVPPRRLAHAERALASAFAIDARSLDELLIRHMKAAAREAGADWGIVLRADRGPQGGADWATLMRLVGHRALPRVRAELAGAPRALLLTNLGLLARYDQMTFIDGLRDAAGGPGGPPGVWLLVPSDAQESRPMVDGRPVPVFTAAQWARVPAAWLAARRAAPPQNPSSSGNDDATAETTDDHV